MGGQISQPTKEDPSLPPASSAENNEEDAETSECLPVGADSDADAPVDESGMQPALVQSVFDSTNEFSVEPIVESTVETVVPPTEKLIGEPVLKSLQYYLDKNTVRLKEVIKVLQSLEPDLESDLTELRLPHVAVLMKDIVLLDQALREPDVDANAKANGCSPLYLAALVLHLSGVQVLLKRPEILSSGLNGREHRTALMAALATNHDARPGERMEIIRELLQDERCSLSLTDKDSWIALTYAARIGDVEAGVLLLSKGRSQKYEVEQLLNACRIAYLSGHKDFCPVVMKNISSAQCSGLLKEITAFRDGLVNTPLTRDLMRDAEKWLSVKDSDPTVDLHPSEDCDRPDQVALLPDGQNNATLSLSNQTGDCNVPLPSAINPDERSPTSEVPGPVTTERTEGSENGVVSQG